MEAASVIGGVDTLRTIFFTVLSLEVTFLVARFARREGRADHARLLALVVSLALDELAPPGLPSILAMLLVVVSAGVALAPHHRATRALAVGGAAAALLTAVAWLAGLRSGVGLVAIGGGLASALAFIPIVLLFLERRWMGFRVFAGLLSGALLWFGGRMASLVAPALPAPGLLFAVVVGVSIVTWWFTPEGPVSGRWYSYAASLEGRLESTEGHLGRQDRLVAIGFLAAGAAHEFRNVLSAIGVLAQLGRRGESAGSKDAALEGIGQRVEEATRNVAAVLDGLSREGREAVRRMSLSTDLDRLMGFVRATCRRDGVAVRYESSGDPVLMARPSEIEHILLNLIRNAARAVAGRPSGERAVTVRAAEERGAVVIEVSDTGGGVPEDVVPRLFAPLATGASGSGLGLYLTRNLVERNGGAVSYVPVPGGSLFRLSFPAAGALASGGPGPERLDAGAGSVRS
jgi:signal transduction histidine kinase